MSAVLAPTLTRRIGRFELLSELGSGAQGTVYLANDTRLEREVALKTLRLGQHDPAQHAMLVQMLIDEARMGSRLAHPNIVTLYDADEEDQSPYLVFEYVPGISLSAAIKAQKRLPDRQAVDIAIGVLRGLACAHGKRVLHRDIKPANIMLTDRSIPRIMDFGIARQSAGGKSSDGVLQGTPSYMAPEWISEKIYTPACDQFSVGVMLYEMLTGAPPVKGANMFETLNRIVTEEFVPVAQRNTGVDAKLNAIVMQALAKRAEDRFASAEAMATALAEYVAGDDKDAKSANPNSGTLEFLLRRIQHKSDFPALGGTLTTVNRIIASDREPISVLCNGILKDVALTSKMLKIVNTAYFSQFGGSISTVSRAVAILGVNGVREVAMSLLLFDHLENKAQAAAMKDEVAATYFSGMLARDLAQKLGTCGTEEVFICAMFHRLGRLLVMFYLPEEKHAIEELVRARSMNESLAAKEILGVSYDDLGMCVARKWNFPDQIVASMRPVSEKVVGAPAFRNDRLRVVADLANKLCDVVRASGDRDHLLAELAARYRGDAGVSIEILASAVAASVKALGADADMLGPSMKKSKVIEHAKGWTVEKKPFFPDETTTLSEQTRLPDADPTELFTPEGEPANDNRQAVLTAGVQDITNTLMGKFELNDVLRIILETMYRGIGFKRVLLCIRDNKTNSLRARFGFGDDVENIVKKTFSIPLGKSRDVFYAATEKGADICIEDVDADKIKGYIPDWYRSSFSARGMVLFPIMVDGRLLALIYGDADKADRLRFKPEELNLLKTLRNQAVLAVRQKG